MKPEFRIITTIALVALILSACAQSTPTQSPTTPVLTVESTDAITEPLATAQLPTALPDPTATPETEIIELTDGFGREISLSQPAQKIVSLAPSNTEILFAVGAGDQVVGRDEFSDYPEEALLATNIGGGFGELDQETIVSLESDLVLATNLTAPEQIEALENLGLIVYALPDPVDLINMYENLETIGKLTGHSLEAGQLIERLRAGLRRLKLRYRRQTNDHWSFTN